MARSVFKGLVFFLALALPAVGLAQPPKEGDSSRQETEVARQKVYPALVNIAVVTRFFSGGRSLRAPAGGSGVIVSKDGLVLTNFHVAGNSTRITCTLPSGEAIDARVILHDPLTDLSVLKLELQKRADPNAPLPFATLGDSDTLQIGDTVLAMGNPMLLSSSLTKGIVSNTRRVFTDFTSTQIEEQELDEGEKTGVFTRWIQHDALILPGNSGGPLVNLAGEVIGINELGGGGVGFAIPSNIAANVLRHAGKGDEIERGWLGFSVLPVSKIERTTGALISTVWPGSSAEKAGLKAGDILLSIDDQPVVTRFFEEVPLLYQRIAGLPVGKTTVLRYERDGKTQTVNATVARMEKYLGKEEEYRSLGLTVQEISASMAILGDLPNRDGVFVTGVRPGYPLESAKPAVMPGDVILAVGDTPTNTTNALGKALVGIKSATVVTIRRRREEILTLVAPPTEKQAESDSELPHAWLGIKTQVLFPDVAAALHLPDTKGFRITEVLPLTEASKAGLLPGDIITALNKTALNAFRPQDSEDLRHAIEDMSVGEKAELTLLRKGKTLPVSVVLEGEPKSTEQAKRARQKEFEFAVRDIVRRDKIDQHWPADQQGVIVTEVTQGGWAGVAGMQPDDLLLAINGHSVNTVAQFEQVMKDTLAQKPKVVQIFLRRQKLTRFVFIEPDWQKLAESR